MKEKASEAIRTFANKRQINEIEALYFLSGAFGDKLTLQDAIGIARGLIEEKLIEPQTFITSRRKSMDIKKLIVNGDITVVTESAKKAGVDPGEVESVTLRLTNGKLAQFDITDRGDGWIRFDSRACLGKSPWNESGNTEGDILESTLQRYLDKEIYRLLPTWLVRMIIYTTRINENDEKYDTWLFAPDASEVFGEDDWYETRYQRLPYYAKAFNRMKVDLEDEDRPVSWWLASARSGNATNAVHVHTNGMSHINLASTVFGVPLCFRINAADLDSLISEALNSGGTVRQIQEAS